MMVFRMNDWKTMARAIGIDAPEEQLDRTVGPLTGLETVFRQAVAALEPGVEPAVIFDPEPGESSR